MRKVLMLAGLLLMLGSGLALVWAAEAKLILEAESFVKEEGGLIKKIDGRIESSGNLCISSWNNKDHVLEWDVEIPETGLYKVVFRYANGRAWTTYRDLMIDGKTPHPACAKIAFPPTGGFAKEQNDWQNHTIVNEKGKPVFIQLNKGKHRIRMNNLGGDLGQDGATNFDNIGFLGKNVNPDVLGKPGAMIYPAAQNNNNVSTPGTIGISNAASALAGKVRFRNQIFPKIELTQNLMYGVAQDELGQQEKLLLDLYQPSGDTASNRPLIILIHGGSFRNGNKEALYDLASDLTKCGFVVASLDYRLRRNPAADWPGTIRDAVTDTVNALRWLRRNHQTYRIDPNRIIIGGDSAGGYIALYTAYMDRPLDKDTNRGGIVGIIDLYGGDITEKIDSNDPAVLIVHGNRDQLMPYEGSLALANKLKQAGVYHEFFTMENEGHSYRNRYYQAILVQVTRFLERVLNPNVPKQGYVPDAKTAIEIGERVLVSKYGAEEVTSHRAL